VVINGLSELTGFIAANAAAKNSLEAWKTLVDKNSFDHFVALKQTFGAADYVAPYTIFDVGGNKFRIVAVVNYEAQVVLIKRVFTHTQYDAWSKSLTKRRRKKK
jgi:mRNA interferase HigB